MKTIDLSVHEIVDFLLRKGSIDDRSFNSASMNEGTRLHKYYQDRQGENYNKEISLSMSYSIKDFILNISGRADGVIDEIGKITIDEIKTTNEKLDVFYENNKEWHLGQAEFYAYMYAKNNNLDSINISLTYLSQTRRDCLKKFFSYKVSDLNVIVEKYIQQYVSFLTSFQKRTDARETSLKELNFPYKDLRIGQKALINETKKVIKEHDISFIEASTGIGKTISTIYGTLECMKEGLLDKIFYLTAKNSGFINALKAVKDLKKNGTELITTQITAKEKICLNRKKVGKCNPDDCPFAINYYTKIKDILQYILEDNDIYDYDYLVKIGKEFKVCPFELSLDLTLHSDVIICDYNYVFDPIAQLQRYFDAPDKQYKNALLVDESHNLIDRSLNMYSASLSVNSFFEAKKDLDKIKLKSMIALKNKISNVFASFKEFSFGEKNEVLLEILDLNFLTILKDFSKKYREYKNKHAKFKSSSLDLFSRDVYKFILIYDDFYFGNAQKYALYVSNEVEEEDIVIHIKCLDSADFIKSCTSHFEGSVFFSATLSPIEYYKKLLVNRENANNLFIPSPFDKEHFKVLVNNNISLLYKDRDNTIGEIVKEICSFVRAKTGNYIVYVPSFVYLEKIKNSEIPSEFECIFQSRDMNSSSRDAFLKAFKDKPKKTLVGVCVLGGAFSEGIDLVGDRLIGIVIVGIGLPQISFENALKKDYYDSIGLNGFDYAYVNVGINKVMQAVGRLIRTETDKGAAFLLDFRYKNKNFKELFNNSWSNYDIVHSKEDIEKSLKKFYN